MEPITAHEGWFVLHLYYRINRQAWSEADDEEQNRALKRLRQLLDDFRQGENCQAHCYSVWGHKADFGFVLVDPDLNHLNQAEFDLASCFPPGSLEPVYSFTSMSEISEYISQEKDYDRTLREKEGLEPGSPAYKEKMNAFRSRIQVYIDERLKPQLPEHRVMCFYPMNKARRDGANWYTLDFEKRKQLMGGHMMTGRKFAGKVQQLVTGSIGLDDWEWGVTLFVDDPFYLKKILYEMRYDEVSAVYGEFGDFYVGIELRPEELFQRLHLIESARAGSAVGFRV